MVEKNGIGSNPIKYIKWIEFSFKLVLMKIHLTRYVTT